jgi:hypothetical protein
MVGVQVLRILPLLSVLCVGTCYGQASSDAAMNARAWIREMEYHGYGHGAQTQAPVRTPVMVPFYVPTRDTRTEDRLRHELEQAKKDYDFRVQLLKNGREDYHFIKNQVIDLKNTLIDKERVIINQKNVIKTLGLKDAAVVRPWKWGPQTKEEWEAGREKMRQAMHDDPSVQNIQDYIQWELHLSRHKVRFFVVDCVENDDLRK